MSLMHFDFVFCERWFGDGEIQPLNIASNLILFVYAWMILRADKIEAGGVRPETRVFIFLMSMMAVSSMIWHATLWPAGLIMDMSAILLTCCSGIWIWLRSHLGVQVRLSILCVIMFLLITTLARDIGPEIEWLYAGGFMPVAVLIFGLGMHQMYLRQAKAAAFLITASVMIAAGLYFRIIDLRVCEIIPTGTHIFWHILASSAVYLFYRAYQTLHKQTY